MHVRTPIYPALYLTLVLMFLLASCTSSAEQQRLEEQKHGIYSPGSMGKSPFRCTTAADCGKPITCDDGSTHPAYACTQGTCGVINYFRDPCGKLSTN